MRFIALKIDVDTYVGTRDGVPRLVHLLATRGIGATFLFSLGPDHTGRALRRLLRPGFVRKVARSSVVSHYGLATLLRGTLLPGIDIGRRAATAMRLARDAGFEIGIHAWDHVAWQDRVAAADAPWTGAQLERAMTRFDEIFHVQPLIHGAAGWQTNEHLLALERTAGFRFASDCRGSEPFVPHLEDGRDGIVQLPTTLPTLDELMALGLGDHDAMIGALASRTRATPRAGHVFTLHAEIEGGRLAPVFAALLAAWRAQGYRLGTLGELHATLEGRRLPRRPIVRGAVPGRSGLLAVAA